MSAPISIASSAQWESILKSHNVVIADFYADWCGPCKVIAPTFERLSKEYSAPKKVAFVKVNVDNQSSISRTHGVSAMPTFIIFHCGRAINTIKGANPPALTSAITDALKLKDQGTPGEYFKSPGRTLGGGEAAPAAIDFGSILNGVFMFLGLYLVSLLSFDPYKAAEASKFNVARPLPERPQPSSSSGGSLRGNAAKRPAARQTFKTLSDLGDE